MFFLPFHPAKYQLNHTTTSQILNSIFECFIQYAAPIPNYQISHIKAGALNQVKLALPVFFFRFQRALWQHHQQLGFSQSEHSITYLSTFIHKSRVKERSFQRQFAIVTILAFCEPAIARTIPDQSNCKMGIDRMLIW